MDFRVIWFLKQSFAANFAKFCKILQNFSQPRKFRRKLSPGNIHDSARPRRARRYATRVCRTVRMRPGNRLPSPNACTDTVHGTQGTAEFARRHPTARVLSRLFISKPTWKTRISRVVAPFPAAARIPRTSAASARKGTRKDRTATAAALRAGSRGPPLQVHEKAREKNAQPPRPRFAQARARSHDLGGSFAASKT